MIKRLIYVALTMLCVSSAPNADGTGNLKLWQVYDGYDEPAYGRHIVLISGDEEYRSEEAMPQLGKILAKHHGFKCTVLFAQAPEKPGVVNPNYLRNIPGLEALESADLMILSTRFRELPDDQMQHIDDYLRSGRPVIGLRTANHGFRFPKESPWAHYGFQYDGDKEYWHGGFGMPVLGSIFFSHHGWHGHESTRGVIAPEAKTHPIVNGIEDGDIWGATDVYGVKLPLPGDGEALVLGQVLAGMNQDDEPLGPGPYESAPAYVAEGSNNKNDPMMPVAWTKTYQVPGGRRGRVFSTTMGAAADLASAGTRRMIVNAVYWCLDLEVPGEGTNVEVVGKFEPTMFGTKKGDSWEKRALRVEEFDLEEPLKVSSPYVAEKAPEFPFFDVTKGREGHRFADHPVNTFRLYDFYAREAEYYLSRPEKPDILPAYPDLDGGAWGHWGRFHKNSYKDRRWDIMDIGSVFSGVLRVENDSKAAALPRAIAVNLGGESDYSIAFDAATLRMAYAWKDGFVGFFPHRWGIGSGIHTVGTMLMTSRDVAGWSTSDAFPVAFADGARGYHGHYRHGKRAVFAYAADGVELLDSFSVRDSPAGPVLERTLEFRSDAKAQNLLLPDHEYEQAAMRLHNPPPTPRWPAMVFSSGDAAAVIAMNSAALRGDANLYIEEGEPLAVQFHEVERGSRVRLYFWTGRFDDVDAVLKAIGEDQEVESLEELTRGGPAQWEWEFEASGKLGDGKGPYIFDSIPVPLENPYGSIMLIGGHDFYSNGDAAVCTMMGDVWRVSGLDDQLGRVVWRRIAAGLNQALGVTIWNDDVYVLGRDRITVLRDLNGDGETDFYENFSDAFESADGGHSFYTGLQHDGAGNFYFAGSVRVVRVTPDGKSSVDLADGLRNPNGIAVSEDGIVIANTNEGEWTPASMVFEVREGDFYGRGAQEGQKIAPPLSFVPRGIDNSTGGQVFVNSGRWGPLVNQLLSFSYGAGNYYMILRDNHALATGGRTQGAVVPLHGDFESGAHRGRFSPRDGQLYVSGSDGWGNYAITDGSFDRVRYTGGKVYLPTGWQAHLNGIMVRFSEPLAPASAELSRWFCQQWEYEYSQGYGSAEYSVRHPEKAGHDPVTIRSVQLLDGGRTLFVEIPGIAPVMQMQLYGKLEAADGTPVTFEMYPTILHLDDLFSGFAGYQPVEDDKQRELALRIRWPVPDSDTGKGSDGRKPGRAIEIRAVAGLQYDLKEFRVKAGERISLTFENDDTIPHNLVIVTPDGWQAVGELSNAMITDPAAAERHYVPDSPDVLRHTRMLEHHKKETLHFNAPEASGVYPYVCTFPGHWAIMRGEMIVEN